MKKIMVLALMISFYGVCGAKKITHSKWEKPEYKVADSISFLDYQNNGQLLYLISNDDENLYLHAKVTERQVQEIILNYGLSIWLDTRAKGKKQMCINFPLGMEQTEEDQERKRPDKSSQQSGQQNRRKKKELELGTKIDNFELIDFPNEPGSHILSSNNTDYIITKIELNDKGELNYTLKIPYKSIDFDYRPEALISMLIKTGDMPERSQSSGGGGMQGGMQGGMSGGGMSGGEMRGGGPPGGGGGAPQGQSNRQGNATESASPIKIKIKSIELK